MKGYLFSLEALIAIFIVLSTLFWYSYIPKFENHKDRLIYDTLNLLEKENKINSENLETLVENIVGFNITINESCKDLNYFIVSDSYFKIIGICY